MTPRAPEAHDDKKTLFLRTLSKMVTKYFFRGIFAANMGYLNLATIVSAVTQFFPCR